MSWDRFRTRGVPTPRPERLEAAQPSIATTAEVRLNPPQSGTYSEAFFDVLARRETRYASNKLELGSLSELLWHSARRIGRFTLPDGACWEHRPAPSAGGIHPIEVVVQDATGLGDQLYLYDPDEHRLLTLADSTLASSALRHEAQLCLPVKPATLIWFIAMPQRTGAKYNHPESLIWRDAGALQTTTLLAATALKLQPVPIGRTGEPIVSTSLNWGVDLMGVGGLHVSCQ